MNRQTGQIKSARGSKWFFTTVFDAFPGKLPEPAGVVDVNTAAAAATHRCPCTWAGWLSRPAGAVS